MLRRLLPNATFETYLSLTTLASRHAALVSGDIDSLVHETGMRGPPPPPGSAPDSSTGVVGHWRSFVHRLAYYTAIDFPHGEERDRLIAARQQFVGALAGCLRTKYRVSRADEHANDLLCSLVVALTNIFEAGANSKVDLRAACAWMLHLEGIRVLDDKKAAGFRENDRHEIGRVADVVRRMMKRKTRSRSASSPSE